MKAESTEKLNIDLLLDSAFDCLQSGDFSAAVEYCEKILSEDNDNAQAKLYKLMAEQGAHDIVEFAGSDLPFGKVSRDDGIESALHGYIARLSEEYKKDAIYDAAVYNAKISDKQHIESALSLLGLIPDYRDSAALQIKCTAALSVITEREEAERLLLRIKREEQRREVQKKRKALLIGLPIAFFTAAVVILFAKVIVPRLEYGSAVKAYGEGNYEKAISVFKKLDGYKDSTELLAECTEAYRASKYREAEALLEANEPYGAAKAFYEAIGYKDAKQRFDNIASSVYSKVYFRNGSLYGQYDRTFDDDGNVIKSVWTMSDFVEIWEIEYNDKREIIKEKRESYNINSDRDHKTTYREYKYDNNHNVIFDFYEDSDGETYLREYSFNDKGDKIKFTAKDETGEIYGYYYEYVYDEKGNITTEIQTSFDGEIYEICETIYDEGGRIVKYTVTYRRDQEMLVDTKEYTYDNNGNVIKYVYTSDIETDCVCEYYYNDNGNQIKATCTLENGGKSCTESFYDDNGNRIKIVETGYAGDVNTYEYEYGDEKNVTKQTVTWYRDGHVTVRESIYDDKGNEIKFTEVKDGELVTSFTYGDFVIVLKDQVR